MIRKEDLYRIGRLGKPHGVKGEIAFLFDDDAFDRAGAPYLVLDIEGLPVPFFINDCRFKNGSTALVTFDGVATEAQAARLTGCEVYLPRSLAVGAGAPSQAELVGYAVVALPPEEGGEATEKRPYYNKVIGEIASIDTSTANILFDIRRPDGTTVLVPAAPGLIAGIDRATRRVAMVVPDGLPGL